MKHLWQKTRSLVHALKVSMIPPPHHLPTHVSYMYCQSCQHLCLSAHSYLLCMAFSVPFSLSLLCIVVHVQYIVIHIGINYSNTLLPTSYCWVQVANLKESGVPVEWFSEENYIFRLSSFKDDLLHWLRQTPARTYAHGDLQSQTTIAVTPALPPQLSLSFPF